MRSSQIALIVALALAASACSQTDPTPKEPTVIVQRIPVELPPEARKPCPALSPKPAKIADMPDDQVFDGWSSDRSARNVCEARRAAGVAAVDAANRAATP